MKHREYQLLRRFITAILIAVTSPFLVTAEHQLPPGARSLANNADITALLRSAIADSALGAAEYDEKSGVWKLSTLVTNTDRWKNRVTLKDPVVTAVAPGEIMHFSLEARVTFPFPAMDYGSLTITLQSKADKSLQALDLLKTFQPTLAWQRFDFVAPATRSDYTPENTYFALAYGRGPQTLEIRNVRAEVYPVGTPREFLPETKFTYPGRETDAKWRAEAQERIKKYRQHDFSVTVNSQSGKPLTVATVSATMTRAEFKFGAMFQSHTGPVFGNRERPPQYDQEFQRLFTFAQPEHDFSNPIYFNRKGTGPESAAKCLGWLEERHFQSYTGILFWPQWHYNGFTKEEIERYKADIPALRARLLDMARIRMEAAKGRIFAWGVMNEIQWQREIMDHLNAHGVSDADMVESLIRLAREVAPKALLVVNEAGIFESDPITSQVKKKYYVNLLTELKKRGVGFDVFGFQGHFGSIPTDPFKAYEAFDLFYNMGLRLMVTEFDVKTDDDALQADYTRDFYTIAYSHPGMEAISTMGHWDGSHFIPKGGLFAKDWSRKPNLEAYEAVRKEWSTTVSDLTPDANGTVKFRGYPGDYELTVKSATGEPQTTRIRLSKENPAAAVTLP